MKRIFSLLAALMCLSVSSVWALDATTTRKFRISDTPTPATELTSGYYILKVACKSEVGYAYVCKNADIATATEKCYGINYQDGLQLDTIGTHNSLAYLWYIGTTPDSKMLCIQNAGDASYFPKQSNHFNYDMKEVRTLANAAAFRYTQVYGDLGVMLYQTNEKMNGGIPYVHANGKEGQNPFTMSCWENFKVTDGSESNCFFTFYKVNIENDFTSNATPAIPIYKYKQQIDGVDKETIENENNVTVMKMNEAPTVKPWETTYSSELYDAPSVLITSSTDAVIFNFTSKDSYCRPDTYYKLKVRGNDKSVYAFETQAQDVVISQNNFVLNYFPERYWMFEKDGLGVKMRCLNGKYIKVSTPSANNTTVLAELVDNIADASTFYMEGKPSKSGTPQGFSLKYAANTYLGDHSSSNLGVWRNSNSNELASQDKGSCFVIESNLNDDLAIAKNLLSTRLNNMTQPSAVDANMLRVATTEQIESAKTDLAAAKDMQGVVAAYNKAFTATPDAKAFYRIKCIADIQKRYPSSEDIVVGTDGSLATAYKAASDKNAFNRTITRKKSTDLLIPQLWQFVSQGDGTYKIKNANNSCCWANTTSSIDMPISTTSGGNYRIVALPTTSQLGVNASIMNESNDGVTTFQLLLGGYVINANGRDTDENLAAYNNHDEDDCNYWQIEKIENFDVAISDAKYATVGYPFNVKVTNKDVRVYYAKSAANGVMKLTEATDKIIPANQGAILYYEGKGETTANLDIVSERGAGFVDNILTASTAKRTGFETKTTYGLSYKNKEVSFRLNTDTYVPANKSYLLATNYNSGSGNAQQLLFSFDNVVEGIDNAVVDGQNANKVYYDLQGRRVMYPAHGIFVTENGEKVFIK